jgi:hypothetical protein
MLIERMLVAYLGFKIDQRGTVSVTYVVLRYAGTMGIVPQAVI